MVYIRIRIPGIQYPTWTAEDVGQVPLQALDQQGIRVILLDLDNTITPRKSMEPTPGALHMLAQARKTKMQVVILSNIVCGSNRHERVRMIAERMGTLPFWCACFPHMKPHRWPYIKAMQQVGARPAETVMVGDQLFADIKGAAKLGIRTVLVKPLGPDQLFTKPRRLVQNLVMWLYGPGSPTV